MPKTISTLAPEWAVSEWFNTPSPLTLAALRGRPVLIHSFQLLCPGCVAESIPQVQRIERVFGHTDLQVIGIHTVFEHHAAMSPLTLKAFLHEYRIKHPVGVDQADGQTDTPITMRRFALRGTPSSILIGRDGSIIHQTFGVEEDMMVGARIAMALSAPVADEIATTTQQNDAGCADGRCELPSHSAV
ncbi:TlpA disulfide reductase family protein [Rhizobium rhizophilum]|uniref:TlpA family protein disulfide reductase n=1 Tax=Rhizobium rhizophilum TaxID=1850373 RepID=A0ABY2QRM8_9HYPH|nr:TlpA disulfide reductase family protein [Rhizobium rhizophilum]THV12675.1 TlpA family protein disulfide reductase [Rhizobium rhizophilum]